MSEASRLRHRSLFRRRSPSCGQSPWIGVAECVPTFRKRRRGGDRTVPGCIALKATARSAVVSSKPQVACNGLLVARQPGMGNPTGFQHADAIGNQQGAP